MDSQPSKGCLISTIIGAAAIATIVFGILASSPSYDASGPVGSTPPTFGSAPSTTAEPLTPDVEAAMTECEALVRDAQVVFEPTRRMRVGRVDQITVKASVGATPELEDASDVTVGELAVRCFVQARLRGFNFDIEPSDFQVRSFLDQQTVGWTWDVEPKREGDMRLTLEVQSLVLDKTGAFDEFVVDIVVEAQERSLLQAVNEIATGFVGHPVVQFVGAAGLVAVVSWLLARFRRKRSHRQPDVTD